MVLHVVGNVVSKVGIASKLVDKVFIIFTSYLVYSYCIRLCTHAP
jgi:hypothetical protein